MSVIVSRALPDVRDGLKPVQRRILYAMSEIGPAADNPLQEVRHRRRRGDGQVPPARRRADLRRHGAHGAGLVHALPAGRRPGQLRQRRRRPAGRHALHRGAARRHRRRSCWPTSTRTRSTSGPTTTAREQEPIVLPARLPEPAAQRRGRHRASAWRPTSRRTTCARSATPSSALHRQCRDHDRRPERHHRGPDFPTGGIIYGREGIKQAYSTGRGRIIVRAKAHIEEIAHAARPDHRHRAALPGQQGGAGRARSPSWCKTSKIDGISDLRDESDRQGMRIVIELRRDAASAQVLNQLFKFTAMQTTFAREHAGAGRQRSRARSASRGAPALHRLPRAGHPPAQRVRPGEGARRAHILEGLLNALDNLDAVIATIRGSASADAAAASNLQAAPFKLSEQQAKAILDMQLGRLAALERQQIEDEFAELIKTDQLPRRPARQPREDRCAHQGRPGRAEEEVRRRAPHPDRRAGGDRLHRRRPDPARGGRRHAHAARLHQAHAAGDRTARSGAAAVASPAWPRREDDAVRRLLVARHARLACSSSPTVAASSSSRRTGCRTRSRQARGHRRWST